MKNYFINTIKFLFRHILYNSKKPKQSILNLIALLYLIILLVPYPFFQNKYTIDNFKIYSSSHINNADLENIIDNSEALLSKSLIYSTQKTNKLFVCNNKILYLLFNPLSFRWSFGVNYPFWHNLYLSRTDFSINKIFNYKQNNNSRNLSSVIAHEVMHTYLAKYIGEFKNILTKTWKKEGYCEYIANDSSFDIETGLELIKAGKEDNSNSFKYFKYRLYVTYLLDIKGIKLETLIETEFDIDQLDNEIKTNINSLEEIFKIRMLTDGITIVE